MNTCVIQRLNKWLLDKILRLKLKKNFFLNEGFFFFALKPPGPKLKTDDRKGEYIGNVYNQQESNILGICRTPGINKKRKIGER